jgi:hypothetical protein
MCIRLKDAHAAIVMAAPAAITLAQGTDAVSTAPSTATEADLCRNVVM